MDTQNMGLSASVGGAPSGPAHSELAKPSAFMGGKSFSKVHS